MQTSSIAGIDARAYWGNESALGLHLDIVEVFQEYGSKYVHEYQAHGYMVHHEEEA
jgi:hypothetical protein